MKNYDLAAAALRTKQTARPVSMYLRKNQVSVMPRNTVVRVQKAQKSMSKLAGSKTEFSEVNYQ